MNSSRIKHITARQILDSKFRPVLEVDIFTEGGALGRGAAPTGSSVGKYEAFILRDGDMTKFDGMSVHKAVDIVTHVIAPALIGMDVTAQQEIDQTLIELDGTPNKQRLGGNTIYSTSIATLRAAAAVHNEQLYHYIANGKIDFIPMPNFNVINGGYNPGITQAFNEFMIIPYRAEYYEEATEMAIKIYRKLEEVIQEYGNGLPAQLGGSYGWIAPSGDPRIVLNLLEKAIAKCGFKDMIAYGIDCASSQMYDENNATYELMGKRVSNEELIDYVKGLTEEFNLLFVEDLLEEDDWEGYAKAKKVLTRTNIFGDDLTVTNPERLRKAHSLNAIDGFVLKPNQIGTITEALEAFQFAKNNGIAIMASGRSGGVINDVIADLSIGLQTEFAKNGAPKSGERIEKMNYSLRASSENPNTRLFDCSALTRF